MDSVHDKEKEKTRMARGAAVWRPVVMHLLFYRVLVRRSLAEAGAFRVKNYVRSYHQRHEEGV